MQETLLDLGYLLLKSVPTIVLFAALTIYLKHFFLNLSRGFLRNANAPQKAFVNSLEGHLRLPSGRVWNLSKPYKLHAMSCISSAKPCDGAGQRSRQNRSRKLGPKQMPRLSKPSVKLNRKF